MSHELDRLGSLTYGPDSGRFPLEPGHRPTDASWDAVVEDVGRFRERLTAALGRRIPLAVVIEHHKDGHLHVHFACGRWLSKRVVEQAWRRGWVDVRRFQSGALKLSQREMCRMNAHYLTSYLKKDFTEGHQFARHRYSTTRGMAPESRQRRSLDRRTLQVWLSGAMGGDPAEVWTSEGKPGWENLPPVMMAYWNGDPPRGASAGG